MKEDLMLFKIIHSRKLPNKLMINFIAFIFCSILRYTCDVWL
jgi:hypothetical protein